MASFAFDGCFGSADLSPQCLDVVAEFIDPERVEHGLRENWSAPGFIFVEHDSHPLPYKKVRVVHP